MDHVINKMGPNTSKRKVSKVRKEHFLVIRATEKTPCMYRKSEGVWRVVQMQNALYVQEVGRCMESSTDAKHPVCIGSRKVYGE